MHLKMDTSPNRRETVFNAALKLATGIYGASPAAETLAEKIMHNVVDPCGLLESRTLLERARKTWLGHPDKDFIAEIDEHLGLGKSKANPGVVCYADGISCPGCPHYHDPAKNPDCRYKSDSVRRTIDDASDEEWLHAAARVAGGEKTPPLDDDDDRMSPTTEQAIHAKGDKESMICAVWLGYQTELIDEKEVIKQSVALAAAADAEICALRKENKILRETLKNYA